MSDPVSYVITTQRPEILQQMLQDAGFMEYFESKVELNQLHIRGRSMGAKNKYKHFEPTIKNFSKQYPLVVEYYYGCIPDLIHIFAYKNGKCVFGEDFSYTTEQYEKLVKPSKPVKEVAV